MRKKSLLLVSVVLSLLLCGFAYANKDRFFLKEFYDSTGETVYYPYPVYESAPKNPGDNNISVPEAVNIGDIFRGEEGYERVIAVSKDGAFVTEVVPFDEEAALACIGD